MDEQKIKKAFEKVKQDIDFLAEEIHQIRFEINKINQFLKNLQENKTSTDTTHNTTHPATSTHNTTVRQEIEGLNTPNLGISIGNEGASTDRQTDRQTDTSTHFLPKIPEKPTKPTIQENQSIKPEINTNIEQNIQEASEILDSLDRLKKKIRFKFKRVTPQEMSVFSTIYQLEEQNPNLATYKEISSKLSLSESSIRDYVQRMINKGIPIKKQKIANKKIILSISPDLKKIATLSTIVQLRDI